MSGEQLPFGPTFAEGDNLLLYQHIVPFFFEDGTLPAAQRLVNILEDNTPEPEIYLFLQPGVSNNSINRALGAFNIQTISPLSVFEDMPPEGRLARLSHSYHSMIEARFAILEPVYSSRGSFVPSWQYGYPENGLVDPFYIDYASDGRALAWIHPSLSNLEITGYLFPPFGIYNHRYTPALTRYYAPNRDLPHSRFAPFGPFEIQMHDRHTFTLVQSPEDYPSELALEQINFWLEHDPNIVAQEPPADTKTEAEADEYEIIEPLPERRILGFGGKMDYANPRGYKVTKSREHMDLLPSDPPIRIEVVNPENQSDNS